MNYIVVLRYIYVALYFIIAAQAAYFFLGYYQVLKQTSPDEFIYIRKLTDAAVRSKLQLIYITSLVAGIVLAFVDKGHTRTATVLFMASFLLLVLDIVLAKAGSEPINKTINSLQTAPAAEKVKLQQQWLRYILIRGCLSGSGFLLLLLRGVIR